MTEMDVVGVVALERGAYQFPWSEGIFRDCLRVGYTCRVVTSANRLIGYGVMSVGAGEAHILNLCLDEGFRCQGIGRRMLDYLLDKGAAAGMSEAFLEVRPSNTAAKQSTWPHYVPWRVRSSRNSKDIQQSRNLTETMSELEYPRVTMTAQTRG